MIKRTLPRLVGTRELADLFVNEFEGELQPDASVEIDCGELERGTESFADQLVLRVLVQAHAKDLVLKDPPSRFARYATESARLHGVENQLRELVSS